MKSYADVVKSSNITITENSDRDNLSEIYRLLLENDSKNSSIIETSPSKVCTNTSILSNSPDSIVAEDSNILSSQDKEILSILEDLQKSAPSEASN